jgi:hypothetical protein
VIIAGFNKPVWNRHRLVTGIVLSILAVAVFMAARQPYAGIVCFSLLVIKGVLIAGRWKNNGYKEPGRDQLHDA